MTTPKLLPPKSSAKGQRKTRKPRGRGLPFQGKDDPRNGHGHGPPKGEGGRPTNEFLLRMEGLANLPIPEEILKPLDERVARRLAAKPALLMSFMRLRLEAWRDVCDRRHGRPVTPIAVDTEATRRQVLKSMTNEELIAALHTLDSAAAHAEA
jgi:hypothetical protein